MLAPTPRGPEGLSTLTSEIMIRARALINESSSNFWSDTELLNWLNRGQFYIVKRSWCLGIREQIQISNNTSDYSPVTSLFDVAAVLYYADGGRKKALIPGDPLMQGHIHDVGEPTHWYYWVNDNDLQVTIFPETVPAGTFYIDVLGVKQPVVITVATAGIEIPAIYEQVLVNYITALALFKDNEEQIALNLLTKVDAEIDLYRVDTGGRESTGSAKDT